MAATGWSWGVGRVLPQGEAQPRHGSVKLSNSEKNLSRSSTMRATCGHYPLNFTSSRPATKAEPPAAREG